MADYYPLMARAVASLEEDSAEARDALYRRARETLAGQIADGAIRAREMVALDHAIEQVEGGAPPERAPVAPDGWRGHPAAVPVARLIVGVGVALVALVAVLMVILAVVGIVHYGLPFRLSRSVSAPFSETERAPYRQNGNGGFSPYWVAYIVTPDKDAADQATYVDLNGKRLGPYVDVSGVVAFGDGGKRIAFAAEKAGKWVVVVDGVEKYAQDALLWPLSSWSPTLEGNAFVPQTRAAELRFSPNGELLAYAARTADGKHAVFVNGAPGQGYDSIGAGLIFVAGRIKYYGVTAFKKIVEVHGNQALGPYDTSYETRMSPNGDHYVLWAKRAGKAVLVVDDKESELPGEVVDYAVGDDGVVAYAYKIADRYRARLGAADLPGDYDEIADIAISPDQKKLAFWARTGATWTLVAGDKTYSGYDGRFYYMSGSHRYAAMWSADSQHVAFYVREGDNGTMFLDGQKLPTAMRPPGVAVAAIVDHQGRPVGTTLMMGPQVDTAALVQAVMLRDKSQCEPFSTVLWGTALACVEKGAAASYMIVGDKREGPYRSIRSPLLIPADRKHYAYLVETEAGQQLVIDGRVRPHVYQALYRPAFDEEAAVIALLAVKDGKLLRVIEPLAAP
ncbi:MAG TPA: hypothetical protein VII40_11260 [Xanthobacteraceae bacterium]